MLTIGSRGSALALAQTHWVRDRILDRFPGNRHHDKSNQDFGRP